MMKTGLIIFIRNPEIGKVKTRLAKTIGTEKALQVYKFLLQHTHDITVGLDCDKFLYYSDYLDELDGWKHDTFHKKLQHDGELGERMSKAFTDLFDEGYQRLLIIGSDCLELESELIRSAFGILEKKEVVIGPSADGGYYLLGMRRANLPLLFQNKAWGSSSVLAETLNDLVTSNCNFELLKVLNDVDEEKDLPNSLIRQMNL